MKSAFFGGIWAGAFGEIYLIFGGEPNWIAWITVVICGCLAGKLTADVMDRRKKKKAVA